MRQGTVVTLRRRIVERDPRFHGLIFSVVGPGRSRYLDNPVEVEVIAHRVYGYGSVRHKRGSLVGARYTFTPSALVALS